MTTSAKSFSYSSQSLIDSLAIVQVVHLDYYMLWLHERREFVDALDSPLPVIRVYGSTHLGQRTVVHIHGVQPYFYFRPADVNNTSFDEYEKVRQYLEPMGKRLHDELSKFHHNRRKSRNFIHKMEVVMRTSLYGYYSDPKIFIKVSLRDPDDVKHLVKMLEVGRLF